LEIGIAALDRHFEPRVWTLSAIVASRDGIEHRLRGHGAQATRRFSDRGYEPIYLGQIARREYGLPAGEFACPA